MKKTIFTETQIIGMLKEYTGGRPIKDICRANGISEATFYNWNKKHQGTDSAQLKKLNALKEENQRLKRMYSDESPDNQMLNALKRTFAFNCSYVF